MQIFPSALVVENALVENSGKTELNYEFYIYIVIDKLCKMVAK